MDTRRTCRSLRRYRDTNADTNSDTNADTDANSDSNTDTAAGGPVV